MTGSQINTMHKQRRQFIFALSATVGAMPTLAKALVSTPKQSAGPFYPVDLPLDDDNDLTQVQGRQQPAGGIISDLSGRLIDINGRPVRDTRIEIWQCDVNGRYRHPNEKGNNPIDPNFQGHGHTLTNGKGEYRFRTIRPVPYPGRTPHIHVAVFARGVRPFITQLYIKDEPQNTQDFLFNRIPDDRRHLVVADFKTVESVDHQQNAQFDIILNRVSGTPIDQ